MGHQARSVHLQGSGTSQDMYALPLLWGVRLTAGLSWGGWTISQMAADTTSCVTLRRWLQVMQADQRGEETVQDMRT